MGRNSIYKHFKTWSSVGDWYLDPGPTEEEIIDKVLAKYKPQEKNPHINNSWKPRWKQ